MLSDFKDCNNKNPCYMNWLKFQSRMLKINLYFYTRIKDLCKLFAAHDIAQFQGDFISEAV